MSHSNLLANIKNKMAKNKILVIDIETNDLLANLIDYSSLPYKLNTYAKMWCVAITNVKTGEVFTAAQEEVTKEWIKDKLSGATHIVAHNGIKFDFPALALYGLLDYTIGYPGETDTVFGQPVTFVDTLIMSRLLNPDRYKGHSLGSWGERVGDEKTDFRGLCIEKGYIEKTDPKGHEFRSFCPEMVEYCVQDTKTNARTFEALVSEMSEYTDWKEAFRMETKLADLAINRETLGFAFDKELAIECVEELTGFINELTNKVNPILPPRKMNKGELAKVTPPKTQLIKSGEPASSMKNFVKRLDSEIVNSPSGYYFEYKGNRYTLPVSQEPLEEYIVADISNLDHVKMHLIDLGWVPTEWRERDMTKDSLKKKKLTYEQRIETLNRWWNDTVKGKYTQGRLEDFEQSGDDIYQHLAERLREDYPVRVKTSPTIRVGIEKELCPNLTKLGKKVAFAEDFSLYLTYKHRRSTIAGGDIEEMDFDEESPNTGYLSVYREQDGRVPTPAIELGASTSRYKHIKIANIPRATSLYGDKMRSLFGCGDGFMQLGFDFASLENRIQGHYIYKYEGGPELAKTLIADKPNDLHTINSKKLGISRGDAKSITYACLPMDTEVLTKEGWKKYKELKEGGDVYSYNTSTGLLEEDVILKKHHFLNKTLIKHSTYQTEFTCTPDHRWYGWRRSKTKNKPSTKIWGYFTAEEMTTEHNILLTAPLGNRGGKDIGIMNAKLLGWVLSDGYYKWSERSETTSSSKGKRKGLVFTICQSSKKFTKEIEKLLVDMDLKYTVHIRKGREDMHDFLINSKQAREFLIKIAGYEKIQKHDCNWSKIILEWNYACREAFLETFYLGDGDITKDEYKITQNKGKIHDALTAILMLRGEGNIRSLNKTKKCKVIRQSKKSHITCQTLKKEKIENAEVFCLTTNNSNFIIRQEHFYGITGNCLYGAAAPKIGKMLTLPLDEAKNIVDSFWDSVAPLRDLKAAVEKFWATTDNKYIIGIDGRKIYTRSKHSLLNALFQSGGVICAKYTTVYLFQKLEKDGYCISPFKGKPDVCSMIEYHDENQLAINPKFAKFKQFETEEEAKEFVSLWEGDQLSDIIHGNKYYVAEPNIITKYIQEAIDQTGEEVGLKVPLGFAYAIHKNWYGCH